MLRCELNDGNTARFWFDNWSILGCLKDYIGDSGPRIMGIPLQSTVRQALNARDWSAQSRSRNGLIRNVKDLLRTYDPPDNNMESDVYSWGEINQAGRGFSTRIIWESLRPSTQRKHWSKAVWCKFGVPKHSFTFWTANLNRLPVKRDWQTGE
ncbi:unnamed protein product [Arabis nemorensis]|uniref:Reverse transcriptase zinc-binding domain-containing protein n=1 Tax=Arabis nemorensis TaxID=586526 RepID=A0A565BBN7_9BRAS|nr:unnamed protein product [Arabis nemorensis]